MNIQKIFGSILIIFCVGIFLTIVFIPIPATQVRWDILALTAIIGVGSFVVGIFNKSGKK